MNEIYTVLPILFIFSLLLVFCCRMRQIRIFQRRARRHPEYIVIPTAVPLLPTPSAPPMESDPIV